MPSGISHTFLHQNHRFRYCIPSSQLWFLVFMLQRLCSKWNCDHWINTAISNQVYLTEIDVSLVGLLYYNADFRMLENMQIQVVPQSDNMSHANNGYVTWTMCLIFRAISGPWKQLNTDADEQKSLISCTFCPESLVIRSGVSVEVSTPKGSRI